VVIVEHIISYTCANGAEHDIPSDEVRVLAWGATGFEVACICGPDPLAEADSPPHESVDHLASIYGMTPSPREWLALEAAREGWYDENPWRIVESEGKTPLKLRGDIRDEVADLADDRDRREKGGADEADRRAREVPCPFCGANAGRKCKRPSGHRVRKSHADRKAAVDTASDDPTAEATQANLEEWSA